MRSNSLKKKFFGGWVKNISTRNKMQLPVRYPSGFRGLPCKNRLTGALTSPLLPCMHQFPKSHPALRWFYAQRHCIIRQHSSAMDVTVCFGFEAMQVVKRQFVMRTSQPFRALGVSAGLFLYPLWRMNYEKENTRHPCSAKDRR